MNIATDNFKWISLPIYFMQTYVFIRVYSEGIIKNIEIQISCLKPNLPLHNNIVAAVRVFVSTKN